MNNPEFVSLGTRCTAASIIGVLDVRKASYPFDWIDQPIASILQLVKMPHSNDDELYAYIDNYFNEVRSQRHPSGAWFPHDFIETDNPEQQLIDIKAKYLRRFKRMFDLFESGKDIVFLTVLPKPNNSVSYEYYELLQYLSVFTKGESTFISINLLDHEYITAKYANCKDYINLVVPFPNDWGQFDADIIAALKQNDHTKKYFK